ncbi:2-dehydro-3-deoxygalactonokinase [Agrobacterium tumefaciens]|uniref:2-dehydro-3-deoxygalactonokinase n=1 Tax=Agrobacterium tumefaciens TaxID=358 RepID=UPI0021D325A9|nr:2-dehydro-3-deoxygalactonokinase [Agrobacterium tumefaciens]UXS04603.1 2-dehydro-3-deoxygalactonokinase [Agrobacterium tumefaciens]
MDQQATSIIVDWGTTSLRAALVASSGEELDSLETAQGISTLAKGEHEAALMTALDGWFTAHGALPVAALGMITSRNGWVEVAYVPIPAGPAELAAGTVRRSLPNGSELVFLPGLTDPARQPFPDVMRGEETQVVGYGLSEDATVILPGTHSKWARIKAGRIDGFQTFVTGEIFALLLNHSFIARGATQPPVNDPAAYRWGLEEAKKSGSMLSLLFSARTGGLAGKLSADQLRSYVHGLVIGQEFLQAREAGWFSEGQPAVIVGNDGLNDLYLIAANLFGLNISMGSDDALTRGALTILNETLS